MSSVFNRPLKTSRPWGNVRDGQHRGCKSLGDQGQELAGVTGMVRKGLSDLCTGLAPLSEGTKISMSLPICCGLTLNVNHSITMSSLISTGRRLSPENQSRELEPAPRRMGWFCSSGPLVFANASQGFAGWAATLPAHQPSE